MGAYNEQEAIEATICSILKQTLSDFEFIIINDGSTDKTAAILDRISVEDNRIRVFHRENRGLTKALIDGCSLATAQLIARQDAGDISLPRRLEVQAEFLREHSEAVMVGCGVESVTTCGKVLYSDSRPGHILDQGLRKLDVSKIKGPPHHGGTMFRRSAYLACGGYRPQFEVAQDMDLWLRLCELGTCLGNEETLYRATIEPESISITRRPDQYYFGELAIESARLRRANRSDYILFDKIRSPSSRFSVVNKASKAEYYYFIGSNLVGSDSQAAKEFLNRAIKENPFHFRALMKRLALVFA
jgi:glycosyltransferase involved in cell wall biosynthesis